MNLENLDEEGLLRMLGELQAANRATQANFDEIRQQFPIQPENLSDSIPDYSELEEGELMYQGEEGPEPLELDDESLEIENGKLRGLQVKRGNVNVEWQGTKESQPATVKHGLGREPKLVVVRPVVTENAFVVFQAEPDLTAPKTKIIIVGGCTATRSAPETNTARWAVVG